MLTPSMIRDANRQWLEDAGAIEVKRPDPMLQLRLHPAAQNRVRGLRLRLVAVLPVLTR